MFIMIMGGGGGGGNVSVDNYVFSEPGINEHRTIIYTWFIANSLSIFLCLANCQISQRIQLTKFLFLFKLFDEIKKIKRKT